jgi:hypothetical protein
MNFSSAFSTEKCLWLKRRMKKKLYERRYLNCGQSALVLNYQIKSVVEAA